MRAARIRQTASDATPEGAARSEADQLIASIAALGAALCQCINAEAAAADACAELLASLITHLLNDLNPHTARLHSVSSAEKAARQTVEYKAAQRARLDAECAHVMAKADYDRATLAARLAVAAVERS